MKILFIGDYSNVHATLSRELRRRGHTVTLLSNGCGHMKVGSDIYLERDKRLFSGVRYLYHIFQLLPQLSGFDVVQVINPHFFNLRPGKLRYFMNILKKRNGSLFLSLAGNDHYFVKAAAEGRMFRFSEFRVGNVRTEFAIRRSGYEREFLQPSVEVYNYDFYRAIDGAMALLPEYLMAAEPLLGDRVAFTNLPVDLSELTPSEMTFADGKVKILVGQRSGYEMSKGTDTLLAMARRIESRLPQRVEVVNVRDLAWADYKEVLRASNINLDQYYSYSPGMNALGSMALGRVAGSGAEPEYYDIIGEKELRPIIRVSPCQEHLEEEIQELVQQPDHLRQLGIDSRLLVEKHNEASLVTDRYLSHWEKILNRK